jgi:hypothetical protein
MDGEHHIEAYYALAVVASPQELNHDPGICVMTQKWYTCSHVFFASPNRQV